MGNDQDRFPDADILLTDNIHTLAQSPFGKRFDGQQIVNTLNGLKKAGKIVFADMDDRGDEEGDTIRINSGFYSNRCKTIPVLAHEGAHMYWRAHHPKRDSSEEVVLDELRCELIELEVYTWAKSALGCSVTDSDLEFRLAYLDSAPKGPFPIPGIGGDKRYLRLKTHITDRSRRGAP